MTGLALTHADQQNHSQVISRHYMSQAAVICSMLTGWNVIIMGMPICSD